MDKENANLFNLCELLLPLLQAAELESHYFT